MGKTRILSATILIAIYFNLLSACGYETGQNNDPPKLVADRGGIACQVVLAPNADDATEIVTSPSGNICKDYLISKIAVTVIDVEHDEVATPEPVVWDCDIPERKNSIGDLRPSSNVSVIVEGFVEGETDARWVGTQEDIVIEPGEYKDIGQVILECKECEKDPPELLDTFQDCVDLQPTLTLSFSEDIVPDSITSFTLFHQEDGAGPIEIATLDFNPETDYDAPNHQISMILPILERGSRYTVVVDSLDGDGVQDRFKNATDGDLEFSLNTIRNWYVDGRIDSSGNGESWDSAFKTIQEGIDAASADGCDEVWVRAGDYVLSEPISIDKGIGVFGGFKGVENNKNERSLDPINLNPINFSNIHPDSESNISLMEIDYPSYDSDELIMAIIDGFVFAYGGPDEGRQDANQNGEANGGGIYCNLWGERNNYSLIIQNCNFTMNEAHNGGALYFAFVPKVTVNKCAFNGNGSLNEIIETGGAIAIINSSLDIIDSFFFNNVSVESGGALSCMNVNRFKIINCIFVDNLVAIPNEKAGEGGAIYLSNAIPDIVNCTFYNNGFIKTLSDTGTGYGLSIYSRSDAPNIVNSIVWNDSYNVPEIYIRTSSPNVSYCDIKGEYEGEGVFNKDPLFKKDGYLDLELSSNSPCIDTGNNRAPHLPSKDIAGNPRKVDGIVSDDISEPIVDIGAYEFQP